MVASLTAYLQRTVGLPWRWGRVDCTMWVADWCMERWSVDPAAPWRERYTTEAEMLRLTQPSLLSVVEPQMIFVRRTDTPQEEDVGIVDYGGKQMSAIRFGGMWVVRTPAGILQDDMTTLAAWGD